MAQMQGTFSYFPTYEGKPFPEPLNRFVGAHLAWVNTHAFAVVLDAEDGKIRVVVGDGSDEQTITFTASRSVDVATLGPGGIHNSYTRITSTCYVLYAAWNSFSNPDEGLDYLSTDDDAQEACFFLVPTGTVVNAGVTAALTGNYDSWSKPLGFVSLNAVGLGEIRVFHSVDRKTIRYYDADYGVQVLNDGVSEANAKIDLRTCVPRECASFRIYVAATQTDDDPLSTVTLTQDNGTAEYAVAISPTLGTIAGYARQWNLIFDVDLANAPNMVLNDVLSYDWSATPTGGLDVHVQAVTMFE